MRGWARPQLAHPPIFSGCEARCSAASSAALLCASGQGVCILFSCEYLFRVHALLFKGRGHPPVDAQRAAANLHAVVHEVVCQGSRIPQVAALQSQTACKVSARSDGRLASTRCSTARCRPAPNMSAWIPQGQGACSASHPRWPEQRHYADVWTRAMSCFLHALLTPTSSPQLALRRILTARSSGFGAVKGWCSASSRPSSSFHSNMGKSTTHSRLCWPSCRCIGVQRGGSTRVHGRWRANKGTSGWSRRQWTRCGSQCTARCGESPALARRWLFGPCFCYRTAEHIQTTPVSPRGARANQQAPRHSAHAAALARGAST